MTDLALKVVGLSKEYRLGVRRERYRTLRDSIARAASNSWRRIARSNQRREPRTKEADSFWALQDIHFEVNRGDVVGIIGRNGAGKSTLLKILSRITEPTTGYAEVRGRLGALLEVGTGFHPELTGRENIYLNGAILGMSRAEIQSKFDEIVDFASVQRFVETPVKHYSSGMYLRLAFAVAAHLEPEILIVDEVLAVGDAAFQKRCIGKMNDIASHGRTVLFVSHNLGAVKELCTRGMVLDSGRLVHQGTAVDAISHYTRSFADHSAESQPSNGWQSVRVNDSSALETAEVESSMPFFVTGTLDLQDDYTNGFVILLIDDSSGNLVVHHRVGLNAISAGKIRAGRHELRVDLPALWLVPGVYTAHFKMRADNSEGFGERLMSDRVLFEVMGSFDGVSRAILSPDCRWTLSATESQSATQRITAL